MNTKEYESQFLLTKCQICGVVIRDHPRCSVCGILTGPHHIEIGLHRLLNGKLACESCKELRDGFTGNDPDSR